MTIFIPLDCFKCLIFFFQSFEGPHALLFHRVLVMMTGFHKVLTRFDLSSTAFFLKFSCRAEDEAGSWKPENLEWDRTLHAEKSPLVASVRPCLSACLLPALYKKYLYTESTLNHVYIGTYVLILYTTTNQYKKPEYKLQPSLGCHISHVSSYPFLNSQPYLGETQSASPTFPTMQCGATNPFRKRGAVIVAAHATRNLTLPVCL